MLSLSPGDYCATSATSPTSATIPTSPTSPSSATSATVHTRVHSAQSLCCVPMAVTAASSYTGSLY